ncbi:MAG TPA: transcriptional repressor [Limnochordales bacterium]
MREELRHFHNLLARHGYRVTPQRMGIYEYLLSTTTHPTAEEIYGALRERFPMMSQATVYKTLELLTRLGLVSELGFGDEPNRYDGNPRAHINIRCTRCHRIYDLEDPRLEELASSVRARSGFSIEGQRHEFYGVCPACQARGEAAWSNGSGRAEPRGDA